MLLLSILSFPTRSLLGSEFTGNTSQAFPSAACEGGFLWRRNNSNKQIRSNYNEATNTSIPPPNPPSPRRCCQRMRVGYKPQNLLVVRVRVIHSSNRQKHHSFPLFLSFFFFLCSSSTTIVVEPNLTAFASAFALSSHPSLIALHPPLIISDIHSTPLSFNLHASPTNLQDFWA